MLLVKSWEPQVLCSVLSKLAYLRHPGFPGSHRAAGLSVLIIFGACPQVLAELLRVVPGCGWASTAPDPAIIPPTLGHPCGLRCFLAICPVKEPPQEAGPALPLLVPLHPGALLCLGLLGPLHVR